MKNIFAILFVFLFAVSCGGGSSGTTSQQDEQTPSVSGDAIVITSITGDGSSSDRFVDEMYVTGQNFTDDMTIDLVSDDASFSMDYDLDSSTRITAQLPENLVDGTYELTLVNDVGTARSTVTILQGEDGADGVDGEDGNDGITIATQYYCGASSDLDSSLNMINGRETNVTAFTDGSCHVSCQSSYYSWDLNFYETSSDDVWYAYNSNAVIAGVILCSPWYATSFYDFDTNTATYVSTLDSTYQTVSCSQVYP